MIPSFRDLRPAGQEPIPPAARMLGKLLALAIILAVCVAFLHSARAHHGFQAYLRGLISTTALVFAGFIIVQ